MAVQETGLVTRGIGGFYQVVVNGSGQEYRCRPRGRLRQTGERLLPGDRVVVTVPADPRSDGVIEAVLPRRNRLPRPPIANVDQVLIVMALANPDPDRFYLDRLLVAVLSHDAQPVLCLNKLDLVDRAFAEGWAAPYRPWLPVYLVSAREGTGVDQLRRCLEGRVTTLAGPSGAGKSALLNALNPAYARRTGELSHRLKRGRHTTRAVELLPVPGGGWVADTPGFSQIDLSNVSSRTLAHYFPDMAPYASDCRFSGCLHAEEPGCAVVKAVAEGRLDAVRYRHYTLLLAELRELEAHQYR